MCACSSPGWDVGPAEPDAVHVTAQAVDALPSDFPSASTDVVAPAGDENTQQDVADVATEMPPCDVVQLCWYLGLCHQTPGGECVALSDKECFFSDGCTDSGACHESGGSCIVTSSADCAASDDCFLYDWCSFASGACWYKGASDAECSGVLNDWNESPCSGDGACTAIDGVCMATSTEACTSSSSCSHFGRCALSEGRCVVGGPADCLKSKSCTVAGQCTYEPHGLCIATSDEDCRRSAGCKMYGDCTHEAGSNGCIPGTDADCAQSERCAKWQYCTKQGDVCDKPFPWP